MPGNAPMAETEREVMLGYLTQQRDELRYAAYGLTEEQIRQKPTKSALSIGALIRHAAHTERCWTPTMQGRARQDGAVAYLDTFHLDDGETLATLLAEFIGSRRRPGR